MFGVLFLITFVTSIGVLALFQSVLDDPAGYIGTYAAVWGFRKDAPILSARRTMAPQIDVA